MHAGAILVTARGCSRSCPPSLQGNHRHAQPAAASRATPRRLHAGGPTTLMRSQSSRHDISGIASFEECLAEQGWLPLSNLLWEGNEAHAMVRGTGSHPSWMAVSPPWKVMLLSDGSVTRHLQLLTDLDVSVDCFEMRNIGNNFTCLPEETQLLSGPILQRQVFLREGNEDKQAHVYAASWWDASQVDELLKDKSKPIWVSLSEGRTELYREIKRVYCGHSEKLEEAFQRKGPFWGRHYIFWHDGKPLTVIYEVFSGSLEKYLGPASLKAYESMEEDGS
eukprot:jgi/Tetstr1/460989/TSEL_006140.t1